jgi:hypothetical protein
MGPKLIKSWQLAEWLVDRAFQFCHNCGLDPFLELIRRALVDLELKAEGGRAKLQAC